MIRHISFLAIFLCSQLATGNDISSLLKTLPAGTHPVGKSITSELQKTGSEANILNLRRIEASEISSEPVLEIEMLETARYQNRAQVIIHTKQAVKKGDVVFLTFQAQCLNSENEFGDGIIGVEFGGHWRERILRTEYFCNSEWKQYYARGQSPKDFNAGEAILEFNTSYRPQQIQLANIKLINYENKVKYDDLPVMPVTYRGMEDDAQWRIEALQRIEKYRKSDIEIKVVDHNGKPVENASVSIDMTRNAFAFGGPYSIMLHGFDPSEFELDKFQENFKIFFNKAVFPNGLKWKQYFGEKKQLAPLAYQWLEENNIPVRGHTIIWPGWNYMPKEIRKYENDPEKLKQLWVDRFETILGDWKGKLIEWDVVNEIYMQNDLMKIFGDDIVIHWFKLARKLDPHTKLYYNDANTIANNQPAHRDHYYETIQWLLKNDAPVDGMGFQCHIHSFVAPEVIYQRIDQFAKLSPEIQITEFDIQKPDVPEDIQARYLRDFMIAVFSHPKPIGIITWLGGNPLRETRFNPRKHQCAFLREDWSIKPIGQAWLDLKNKEWHTSVTGTTNSQGIFGARGFHGDYEITITKNGESKVLKTNLDKQDKSIVVNLYEN